MLRLSAVRVVKDHVPQIYNRIGRPKSFVPLFSFLFSDLILSYLDYMSFSSLNTFWARTFLVLLSSFSCTIFPRFLTFPLLLFLPFVVISVFDSLTLGFYWRKVFDIIGMYFYPSLSESEFRSFVNASSKSGGV